MDMLSLPWFVNLLSSKMPLETVNLIWDMFLLYDMSHFFRAILSAISQLHDICLNLNRFDEVLLTIQQFLEIDFTPEMLINSLVDKISPEELAECRKKHRADIVIQINARVQRSHEMQPTYGEQKNFMDKFFSLKGLESYYGHLAQATNLEEHKLAAQILA